MNIIREFIGVILITLCLVYIYLGISMDLL